MLTSPSRSVIGRVTVNIRNSNGEDNHLKMSRLTGKTLDCAITFAAGSGFLLFGYGISPCISPLVLGTFANPLAKTKVL